MEQKSFLWSEIAGRVALNACPFSSYRSVNAGVSCDLV